MIHKGTMRPGRLAFCCALWFFCSGFYKNHFAMGYMKQIQFKPLNLFGGKMRKFYGLAVVSLVFIFCSCGDLLYNAKTGNIGRIQNGLDSGARIEMRDGTGNTPLMIAAFNKQYEALEYLVKKGANVNAQNDNGATALILAAYYNHPDTAKILLKYNADKTIKDKFGNTALDYAEQSEYTRIMSLLKN